MMMTVSELSPADLRAKWDHVLQQARHVFTWTEPETLAYCAERASHATHAVELGSYMGASALVMLLANPRLHLWCVDTFQVAGTEECCRYFLRDAILEGRCELIRGDSAQAAPMLGHMNGRLDYVWVDDGHATPDVIRDITSFMPLLRPGGEMFGHDFDVPHNDVALGVLSCFRADEIDFPVPRVWRHRKPKP